MDIAASLRPRPARRFVLHSARAWLLFMCILPASFCTAQTPIALHPQNPHYFLWRDRPALLVTSGEHYGAVLHQGFDYIKYLDELQQHGLNLTRTFAGTYREIPSSFGITDNTLAPAPGQFLAPWPRGSQSGALDGGNLFDLEQWNDQYFQRLRDFLAQAQQRGIVVELVLFCPMYNQQLWEVCPMNAANNQQHVGKCASDEALTLNHPELFKVQQALVRKIVNELNAFDNLYYEVCNEPYFGGVTMEWQQAIIDTIVETEGQLPHRHLISLNIANGRQRVDMAHPHVSILNFHYCTPPDTVAMNYDLKRVIGENETGFRGQHDVLYRTEGWDFLLAGGALYNNLDYSFTPTHPDGSLQQYQSPGGGSRALRKQLGIMKRFLERFELVKLRPAAKVVQRVSDNLVASALADPGKAYAIYLHVPLPAKPENINDHLRSNLTAQLQLELPAASYNVAWMNTLTGETSAGQAVQHGGGILTLQSPPFDNDIALEIRAR